MNSKLSLLALGGAFSHVLGETILGVTIFTRHGDRTSKHYSDYTLTSLGFQQNYQVGGEYRSTYFLSNSSKQILGISEDKYVPSQIYASAPDQMVLLNAATAFLQGLYPPLEGLDPSIASQTLNNGSTYTNPLNGYQYVVLHGENEESPNTIWIKGDDSCPAYTTASASFEDSTEFADRMEATKSFYEGFWDILRNVYDYKPENMSYANAYDIFDLINVATVHNSSITTKVTTDELFQLRTLADSAEWGANYNSTQPIRSIGGQTLAAAIFTQLNETVASKGQVKVSLLAGSYDTFLAFFGVTNLNEADPNFYGLPEYASTMAFEIFTEEDVTEFPTTDALRVRFLFRNGSDDGTALSAFPLFGGNSLSLSWSDFSTELESRAVTSVEQWCTVCSSTEDFCLPYNQTATETMTESGESQGGMSNAVAGVIGAMVTLGVIGLCGLAFWLFRRRSTKGSHDLVEKVSSQDSGSAA